MGTNNAINLNAIGIASYNGTGTFAGVTITAGATPSGAISIANGNGVGGNPTISVVPANISINALGGTPLTVANGGTGDTTFTANAIVLSGTTSTSALTSTALTNGQVLIGSTGAAPSASTLTAGTGVSITNAAGSITISTTGSGSSWVDVTTATQAMAVNTGYIVDNASGVTFTLPTSATFGDAVTVMGKQSGWKIVYAAGQNIVVGDVSSTTSTGNVASTTATDCLSLICTTASVTAPIFSTRSVQGNVTIV
jgi:hypothetical protein